MELSVAIALGGFLVGLLGAAAAVMMRIGALVSRIDGMDKTLTSHAETIGVINRLDERVGRMEHDLQRLVGRQDQVDFHRQNAPPGVDPKLLEVAALLAGLGKVRS